ncbi:MAG: YhdH/YhfP family quinone oxidoreductase [Caldilineaceae bacterium]|nr:YhdH/YhfP family quinone oxidoreductase [Caldilineaceae bacterium]
MNETSYQALVVREGENGFARQVETRTIADLPAGDLLIKVRYSSLNYKDALSAVGNRGVTRTYPHTPGVDAVGQVVESADAALHPGDWVVIGGYDLGMNTPGGFGQYIRVPANWILPLPPELEPLNTMILGTAGFTAALSLHKLEAAGLRPGTGDLLVTGATGGVGSLAVALLAQLGYRVVAATGKLDQAPLLHRLGAAEVIHRSTLEEDAERALLKQRWAAVVDTVGGPILAGAIKSTKANGWITACGNVASPDLALTVYPFILRGVSLLGIDAANCSLEIRRQLMQKLAGPWRLDLPSDLITITDLTGLSQQVDRTLQGQQVGRVVVDLWPKSFRDHS